MLIFLIGSVWHHWSVRQWATQAGWIPPPQKNENDHAQQQQNMVRNGVGDSCYASDNIQVFEEDWWLVIILCEC